MEINEAIEVLRKHNEWRRYDGEIDKSPEMTDPVTLGKAIDTVVKHFRKPTKKICLNDTIIRDSERYAKGVFAAVVKVGNELELYDLAQAYLQGAYDALNPKANGKGSK